MGGSRRPAKSRPCPSSQGPCPSDTNPGDSQGGRQSELSWRGVILTRPGQVWHCAQRTRSKRALRRENRGGGRACSERAPRKSSPGPGLGDHPHSLHRGFSSTFWVPRPTSGPQNDLGERAPGHALEAHGPVEETVARRRLGLVKGEAGAAASPQGLKMGASGLPGLGPAFRIREGGSLQQ